MRTKMVVFAMVAAAALIAGCGSSSSGGGTNSDGTSKSITIWTSSGGFWDYMAQNLKPFEDQTGIKVKVAAIPGASLLDKTTLAQRNHSTEFAMYMGPTSLIAQDIQLLGGTDVQTMIDNKKVTDSNFNLGDFGKAGTQSCTYQKKLYCIPIFVDGGVLAYNKKLLAQAGVTSPPTTWAQVMSASQAVTQKTAKPGWCARGSQDGAAIASANEMLSYYIPWSAQNKGFFVGPHWNSLLDSDAAISWAKDYQTLMTKNAPKGVGTYTLTNCLNDFDQGKVAMDWDGLAVFGKNELAPAAGSALAGNVGFSEIQCPSADPCVAGGPWGMFLNPRVSKSQQAAAWKLTQYLSSPDFVKKEIASTGSPALAVRNSVSQATLPGVPKSFLDAITYVSAHSEPNPFPATTVFNESQNAYQISISKIVAGGDVTSAMKAAAAGQNQVFKNAGLS